MWLNMRCVRPEEDSRCGPSQAVDALVRTVAGCSIEFLQGPRQHLVQAVGPRTACGSDGPDASKMVPELLVDLVHLKPQETEIHNVRWLSELSA